MYRNSLYEEYGLDIPEKLRYSWRLCIQDNNGKLPGEAGYLDHYGELNEVNTLVE